MQLSKKFRIEDKIIFIKSVRHDNIPKYINLANLCILFKRELKSGYSPLKMYEYMACGKPIIASNVKGLDIIEKEDVGKVVDINNKKKVAEAIITLLSNEKRAKKMGENARNFILKNQYINSLTLFLTILEF